MDFESKVLKKEVLSPKRYLTLTDKEKSNILSTKIIPPTINSNGVGGIEVEYKHPVYKVA